MQLIDDIAWALRMIKARRLRRSIMFSRRVAFDEALRPILHDGSVMAYPDAAYHAKRIDFERAHDVT